MALVVQGLRMQCNDRLHQHLLFGSRDFIHPLADVLDICRSWDGLHNIFDQPHVVLVGCIDKCSRTSK